MGELTGMQSAQASAKSAADVQKKERIAQQQAEDRPFPTSVGDVDMLRRGEDGSWIEEDVDPTRDPSSSEHMHALEEGMPMGKKCASRTGRARAARLDVEIKRGQAESFQLSCQLERAKKEL